MMKKPAFDIGLDTRMLRHTGIGTYIRNVLAAFRKDCVFERLRFGFFGTEITRELFGEVPFREFFPKIYSVNEQLVYPRLLRDCRLWHAPHYNIPLIRGKTRLIVTIHDLIHWIFRKQFFAPHQNLYAAVMLRAAVSIPDRIIAVSEHTKNDLVKHFDADPEKISVIYEAADLKFSVSRDESAISEVKKKYGINCSYFLFVGSLKPHKNVHRLIRLFRELHKEARTDSVLVLAGRKDSKYPAGYEELSTLQSGQGVLHLEGIQDEELKHLYQGALALIHPSLYEGFGLTLLEAMGSGTPVIASQSASIPEVTGDAACLVDSCQDPAMMQAIRRMETDPVYRSELRERGLRRASQFSWRETASKTLALYEKVLSER